MGLYHRQTPNYEAHICPIYSGDEGGWGGAGMEREKKITTTPEIVLLRLALALGSPKSMEPRPTILRP